MGGPDEPQIRWRHGICSGFGEHTRHSLVDGYIQSSSPGCCIYACMLQEGHAAAMQAFAAVTVATCYCCHIVGCSAFVDTTVII